MQTSLHDYLQRCGQSTLAAASSASVRNGANAFLDALRDAQPLAPTPALVPVVNELLDLEVIAPPGSFGAIARQLRWVPSPRGEDVDGKEMALAPLNSHFDLGQVVAGFLVAGAGRVYPEHNHSPQELYLTMAGTGSWRFGGNEHYENVVPGSTFYNPPGVTHSARAATDHPVLAFYVLWP